MNSKKIIVILSVIAALAANGSYSLQMPVSGNSMSIEQTLKQTAVQKNNEGIEGVTEHKFAFKPIPKRHTVKKWDAFGFHCIKSGQYALGDTIYKVKKGKRRFYYAVSWAPMGNYIRVGLLSEDKRDIYYTTCISGRTEGVIDLSKIPAGNYFVVVYNETSSDLELDGAVAYH